MPMKEKKPHTKFKNGKRKKMKIQRKIRYPKATTIRRKKFLVMYITERYTEKTECQRK